MTKLIIRGATDDGENLEIPFEIPDGQLHDWKRAVYLYALEVLWEQRWTPGSVAWQVFTVDGVALRIGENF